MISGALHKMNIAHRVLMIPFSPTAVAELLDVKKRSVFAQTIYITNMDCMLSHIENMLCAYAPSLAEGGSSHQICRNNR